MTIDSSHFLSVSPGSVVWFEGLSYSIEGIFNITNVLARSHKDGKCYKLQIDSLCPSKDESLSPTSYCLIEIGREFIMLERNTDITKDIIGHLHERREPSTNKSVHLDIPKSASPVCELTGAAEVLNIDTVEAFPIEEKY